MPTSDRGLRATATALAAVTVSVALLGPQLSRGTWPLPGVYGDPRVTWLHIGPAVAYTAASLLILHEQPRHNVGWILGISGLLLACSMTLGIYGVRAVADSDVDWPLGIPALALASGLWLTPLQMSVSLLPQRYPDGRLVGPRWRLPWWVSVAAVPCVPVVLAASPGAIDDWIEGLQPFRPPGWLGPIAIALLVFGFAGAALGLVAGLSGLWVRFKRGDQLERRQVAWMVVPVLAIPLATYAIPGAFALVVSLILLAAAIVVGVLRYGMLGTPVTVRRLLVWLPLSALIALTMGVVTTFVGRLSAGSATGLLLASIVIAAVVLPARDQIVRMVDRALYGDRGDPLALVDAVVAADAASPAGLVAAVSGALRSPGAALVTADGRTAATWGTVGPRAHRLDLSDGASLLVEPRRGEARLDGDDRRVLSSLTAFLDALLRSQRLNEALAEAAERTLASIEAERARLRRDLHDGLGPALSGIALGAQAAQGFLPEQPDAAAGVLARIRSEATGATAEVRRVIDDLRPSALDSSTLAAALADAAALLPLEVHLECDSEAGDPPPGTARAAYRIATEALTNAARHASATTCRVELYRAGPALHLVVRDDGAGFEAATPGVGLLSMQHRAEALGGTLAVIRAPGAGTIVHAVLPWEFA